MRVAIVGAGISGLAAGRTLSAMGSEVVVFERGPEVGGRIETRRLGGYVFDTGATSIAPRGMAIQRTMLEDLDRTDLVRVEKPIYTHSGLRVMAGDGSKNAEPRYTYRTGNATLPAMLAHDLDVRVNAQVDEVERGPARGYRILGEVFEAVILTPPIPQTTAILWSLGQTRPVANARYRRCLSVLLGFDTPAPQVGYHALLEPEQRHPLTWLSLESEKSPGRAPPGCSAMVAQLSPSYSLSHFDREDSAIVGDTLDYIVRLYGNAWQAPVVSEVRRWKYSLPDSVALFESVNSPGSSTLIAGDGVLAGRVESAYESGVRAAQMLRENL